MGFQMEEEVQVTHTSAWKGGVGGTRSEGCVGRKSLEKIQNGGDGLLSGGGRQSL